MPIQVALWRTCRKTKREGPNAQQITLDWTHPKRPYQSRNTDRDQSPFPKPVNATCAMCERARRTWPKNQRADNLTEEQCQPKPGNEICEQHN